MHEDYKVLPIAPKVFAVLAWIGVMLGVISALIIFVGSVAPETPRWMGLVPLVVGAVYFFLFMVASEVVALLMEIKIKVK